MRGNKVDLNVPNSLQNITKFSKIYKADHRKQKMMWATTVLQFRVKSGNLTSINKNLRPKKIFELKKKYEFCCTA